MSEELRKCPFCQRRAEHYSYNYSNCRKHTVRCHYCLADCGEHKTPERAAFVWNTRHTEEVLKAELEELAGYVKRFRETLAEVATMAIDAEQEQIFEKCRDALRDVYLEEKFRDAFDKILHNPDTEKGGENEP